MKKIVFYLFIFTMISACSSESIYPPDGVYEGTFIYYTDSETFKNNTILELKDGRYISSGNTHYIPAGGSGTFSVKGNKIIFQDENFWTANFDWGLILSGEYTFSHAKDKLSLIKESGNNLKYEYKLSRKK